MKTVTTWTDEVPDNEGQKQVVWDLCFRPDGSQLIVAVGKRIVIYDANHGDVIRQKVAHQGDIHTVSASRDGAYIASGGADKTVSIWTYELGQKYTFTHADSIQAVAFNPVTPNVLASCSAVDFAIWTMPSSSLKKLKVPSKILCAAWTTDGQYLALGMFSGNISVRDMLGAEKVVIERNAPVWDICWMPSRSEGDPFDTLAVACWDSTLSFYQLTGQQIGKDKQLSGDACSVRLFPHNDYLVVAGSDHKAVMMTRDGVQLSTVVEAKDWIWRACPRPKSNSVAVATNDGVVSMHTVSFSIVHGLYQDRYAFRDNMTDVVVQHLVSEQRVRLKCRDYVKKIAVYRDRLAVQLPDRIVIYEVTPENDPSLAARAAGGATDISPSMLYRVKDRLFLQIDCNLLVVTSHHVMLCQDSKLQLFDFSGRKVREWVLEAVIRYIKVAGGPAGREGVLVGLKNGSVLKIFVDNPFPTQLLKHKGSIRCLDLSMNRRKLALVDEHAQCVVFDVVTGEQLFSEPGANSVAWNTEMEDMLCFSGNGMLSIKTGSYPLHQQKLAGFVVGFQGSKIFCLHSVSIQTIDVPQSASLYRYMEDKEFEMAYRVACLGVTEGDWRSLGEAALKAMQLPIARSCFVRVRDMRYIELINHIEAARRMRHSGKEGAASASPLGDRDEDAAYLAEIMAYAGKHQEAAKLHLKAGTPEKAIEMLTDLRLWNDARKFAEDCGRVNVNSLLLKQATWCEEAGDVTAAATIYSGLGQMLKAVTLLGERAQYAPLLDLVRTFPSATRRATAEAAAEGSSDARGSLSKDSKDALQAAGAYFRKAGLIPYAKEVYLQLDDQRALLQILLDGQQWSEALALAERNDREQGTASVRGATAGGPVHPDSLVGMVHQAKGEVLAAADQYEEAQREFELAGRPDLSARILAQLAQNAVAEDRFADAAFFYHRLSEDTCSALRHGQIAPAELPLVFAKYRRFEHFANVYHAYAVVYDYISAPFTTSSAETVFNAARFVLNACVGYGHREAGEDGSSSSARGQGPPRLPPSVSVMRSLYALARQGMMLEAYKVTRFALERLAAMHTPAQWQDTLDLAMLALQSKPFSDKEELQHVCYRCGAPVPLVSCNASSLAIRGPAEELAPDVDGVFFASHVAQDVCPTCGHAVIRSAFTFEPLPLVEFAPEGVDMDTALAMITAGAGSTAVSSQTAGTTKVVGRDGSISLSFNNSASSGGDVFAALLVADTAGGAEPVKVPLPLLRTMSPADVFLVRPRTLPGGAAAALPTADGTAKGVLRMFKNVMPELPVSMCSSCCRFFHTEDLEFEVLKRGSCPFCRV